MMNRTLPPSAKSEILEEMEKETLHDFHWWTRGWSVWSPPPDISISEWADRHRQVAPETSASPGQWSTKRVPYLREVMDACSPRHPCRRIVLVKPTQSGGTEACVLNLVGHSIDLNPRSMLIVFPSLDLAESFSRERLEPMIAMMPRLRDKLPTWLQDRPLNDRASNASAILGES